MEDLEELLLERNEILEKELTSENWEKLKGEQTVAGKKCDIHWSFPDYELVDEGYLFDLPIGNESDEGDIFVHIPEPENPSGMDTPPPVFTHLQCLMCNILVSKIIIK